MAYSQATINSTDPANAEAISGGASRMRALAAAIKERLVASFVNPDADPMVLKAASMPTDIVNLELSGLLEANSAAITTSLLVGSTLTVATDADVGGDLVVGGAITGAVAAAGLTGTLPDATFPLVLPAASGENLTDLDAAQLVGGPLDPGVIPSLNNITGAVTDGQLPATMSPKTISTAANNGPLLDLVTTGTGTRAFNFDSDLLVDPSGIYTANLALPAPYDGFTPVLKWVRVSHAGTVGYILMVTL